MSAENVTTKFCQGISDISDSYMGFIIDQWGVLHNGEKPYDGVIECLKELRNRHKFIIVLSNSGKRAQTNIERLEEIGISRKLYDVLLTSGEMAWQGIKNQDDKYFEGLGNKCFLISRGGDRSIVEGLDVEVVKDIKKASFLLISGADAPDMTIKDYEAILKEGARRSLKAICANPDSLGVMGGGNIMGPGTLARRYQDYGGVVYYIGKPHQPIFNHCIKLLQEKNIYPGQTVVVGDTMAHDILGGDLANMDTCLVRSGLHKPAFKNVKTPAELNKALNTLVAQYNGVRPKYMVHKLSWGKALPDRKHKKRASR
ncbi:MAG TPA: TIGR01459 family HAD-type hydrolase [Rhodospirillaceae bacterium]|nr:TIGR01459 family HAD-type hydrolase [Rhodospirillaceae bacterium]